MNKSFSVGSLYAGVGGMGLIYCGQMNMIETLV